MAVRHEVSGFPLRRWARARPGERPGTARACANGAVRRREMAAAQRRMGCWRDVLERARVGDGRASIGGGVHRRLAMHLLANPGMTDTANRTFSKGCQKGFLAGCSNGAFWKAARKSRFGGMTKTAILEVWPKRHIQPENLFPEKSRKMHPKRQSSVKVCKKQHGICWPILELKKGYL